MDYIKTLYYKNKKIVLFILAFLIILLCLISYFNFKNDNNVPIDNSNVIETYDLVLFGDIEMTVYKGDAYQEPGYYATYKNEIVTDRVEVINLVDTKKVGSYTVVYIINDIKKTRVVKVIDKPNTTVKDIKLELNGSSKIILNKGDTYQELGATLIYDNKNISDKIKITGSVNTSKPGTYYLTYSITIDGITKSIKREIVVLEKEEVVIDDLKITVDYDKTITNKDVVVNVVASGTNFSYIKLPNGSSVNSKSTTYNVSLNGVYYFFVYDTFDNYKMASINVDNIDKIKPTASCNLKSYSDRTVINVVASDNIGIDKYIYNNQYKSTSNTYTINKKLNSANVQVYDKASNVTSVNCNIENSLIEMHFIAGVSDDDAILIRTSDKTIMIDGGRYEASDKIVSYLKNIGVKKIDALIGSHVHWNHVQSHAAIIDNFEVGKVYYSTDILNCVSLSHCEKNDILYIKDKLLEKNITPTILKSKSYLELGDMKLYFIGPIRGKLTTYQNANSLVFILKYGNNKFMFTGDTPDKYMDTTKFLNEASYFNMNIDIDVLKWPHHGYETLTDEFFKQTTPKYAIIPNCCSSSNTTSTTNKNLMKKYGTNYYQISDSKNIVLTSDGDNIVIKTNQDPNYWRR